MNISVDFFDQQFARQALVEDLALNPFEQAALPHLTGRLLDHGCGLGNLSLAAARRGCRVVAVDASAQGIQHLSRRAAEAGLPVEAIQADLRHFPIPGSFDAVVSIGLLMFFDRPTALRTLAELQSSVRPGGVAVINVLIEGTTYLDMFDPAGHCLFARDELLRCFQHWHIVSSAAEDFEAPGASVKSFHTLIARKPGEPGLGASRPEPQVG